MASRAGLSRNPDFLKLWTGQTVSAFGSMLGALGLTALVYLDASPGEMGLLAMAQGLPVLLFALFAGVWIDRLRRRPIMIAADIGRAALLVTVPVAAVFDALMMWQLYAVAFGAGTLELAFNLAYRSYLPSLVDREALLDGNAKLSASESVAEVAAPAAGGAIVQALGGPAAALVDALTFLWSAAFVGLIGTREDAPPRDGEEPVLSAIREGLGIVWRDRILRALTAASGTFRFFGGFFAALYGIFLIRDLGFSPLLMGITVGAGGIGSLAGSMLAGRMNRGLGYGPSLLASRLILGGFSLLIPLAGGPKELAFAMIVIAQVCGDPFWTTYEISSLSLRQEIAPQKALGRVNSTMQIVEAGLQPVGSLVAGVLAEVIGVRETLLLAVAGGLLGTLWLVASPIPRLRGAPAASSVEVP